MISYETMSEYLVDSGYTCAEAHGLVSAFCCASGELMQLQHLFAQQESQDIAEQVRQWHQDVSVALKQEDLSFELILVERGATLGQRTGALALWCQGFLNGLELNHIFKQNLLSEECLEAIDFFKEVKMLETFEDQPTESDEKDFVELEEYIRVAVMMIFTELQMEQAGSGNTQQVH